MVCPLAHSGDCIPGSKLEFVYSNDGYAPTYNLRDEAYIRGSRKLAVWTTDCPVPVEMVKMKSSATEKCNHNARLPNMTMSIGAPSGKPLVMTLRYGGKEFVSDLIPHTFKKEKDPVLYMESSDRFLFEGSKYDIFVYLRHHADASVMNINHAYKTYRVEFFDVKDTECRDTEAPYIDGIITVSQKTLTADKEEIAIDKFYEWIGNADSKPQTIDQARKALGIRGSLATPDPISILETQVGDGSEPKR
jgi:hypothetical protein